MKDDDAAARAAAALQAATALLITAGAGMGVDSGLPDFRGDQGFWAAYPPYRHLGLSFQALAQPRWFERDPELAWGFYGHRLNLYRATVPHPGFALLRAWAAKRAAFVFTSNVDGQFQRAGFDAERIVECHGALSALQCLRECGLGVVPAEGVAVTVDATTFRAVPPLPTCPRCGALLRPNVLMFGDWGFDPARVTAQEQRFEAWLGGLAAGGSFPEAAEPACGRVGFERLVVVECGAGTAIPTVRRLGEELAAQGATLIRINPREAHGPPGTLSLACGARAGLEAIAAVSR